MLAYTGSKYAVVSPFYMCSIEHRLAVLRIDLLRLSMYAFCLLDGQMVYYNCCTGSNNLAYYLLLESYRTKAQALVTVVIVEFLDQLSSVGIRLLHDSQPQPFCEEYSVEGLG